MSDGFVRLYRRDWSPAAAAQRVESLAGRGLVPGYPGTGRITAISGEWETIGEQVEMDRDGLLAAMGSLGDKQFTFQYWVADEQDSAVFCTLARISAEVVVEDYSLDGLGGPVYRKGQDVVIRRLLAEFHATGPAAVGLVVDRWGPSLETDLDDIVVGGPTPVTIVPELLVLRPEVAAQHPELTNPLSYGDFVAFDADGILKI